MANRSAQIRQILRERYECTALPPRALSEIAREVGVTRALVGFVAKKEGFTGHSGPSADRWACAYCGKDMGLLSQKRGKDSCADCRWIELPCANCGSPVRRRIAELVWRINNKKPGFKGNGYQGRVFCDRSCFGQYSAKAWGWGTEYQKNKQGTS